MAASLVSIARAWIGTPYVHQGARRGVGCDCLGLLRGVLAQATDASLAPVPPYTPDWSEPQGDEELWRGLSDRFAVKSHKDAAPGDVVLFRMRQGAVAKHVGIQAETGPNATFIHAYQRYGVCESALSLPWQRRLVARFAVPDDAQDKV